MCDQHKLSDRAFDSQVSADYGNRGPVGYVDTQDIGGEIGLGSAVAQQSPIDQARVAYAAIKAAQQITRDGGPEQTVEGKQVLISALIAPFYIGDGDVDHLALLDALESFKGQPLNMVELRVWGAVVGAYCAQKGVEELSAAFKAGKVDKVEALVTKFLSQ